MDFVHVHAGAQTLADGVAVQALHVGALVHHRLLLLLVQHNRRGLLARRTVTQQQLRLQRCD